SRSAWSRRPPAPRLNNFVAPITYRRRDTSGNLNVRRVQKPGDRRPPRRYHSAVGRLAVTDSLRRSAHFNATNSARWSERGQTHRGPLDRVRFSFNIREREIKVMFARRLVVIIMLVAFACNLSALAAARPASFASEGQAFTLTSLKHETV